MHIEVGRGRRSDEVLSRVFKCVGLIVDDDVDMSRLEVNDVQEWRG